MGCEGTLAQEAQTKAPLSVGLKSEESGIGELNPCHQLGKLGHGRYTNPACNPSAA